MDGTNDVTVTKTIIADEVTALMIGEETVMTKDEITTVGETTMEDAMTMMTDIIDERTTKKNTQVATEMRKMME